jgi:hypothetical protein
MGKLFLFLSLELFAYHVQANELDLVLAKYPLSIQEQVKKFHVRSNIKDLIPTYEMKCDRDFCERWSKVTYCPKCCVKRCISSHFDTNDCNGSGWCSQPFFSSIFSETKYIELNVFELFQSANAHAYLYNKKNSPSRKREALIFESRHEEFTVNPIDPKTYEVVSTNGRKQIQSMKIFEEEKIEALLLSSGLKMDFKTDQLTYKGNRCSIRSKWVDYMKQSRKSGLCFVGGGPGGVYGVVIVGSELVLLRQSGGIDFCDESQDSIAELDPGCT